MDFLRGLCILEVVIHHTNLRLRYTALPDFISRPLFWSGSYSVKVFFVVSGFLITSSILARWDDIANIDIKAFYRLRFARIAPCLLGLLVILAILHLTAAPGFIINPQRTNLPRALLAALTFHVNWLETKVGYLPGSWDILWSLSVEETFYLFYPLLCRYVRKRWMLLAMVVGLMAAGPFFRTSLAPNDIGSDYALLANLDGIALGCVAGVLARSIRFPMPMAVAGWALIGLVILVRPRGPSAVGLDVTILEIGTALVVMAAVHRRNTPHALSAPIRWYGRQSYEVYLTHMFVVTIATQLFASTHVPAGTAPLWFAGIVLIAGLLGYVVARWYSEPLNRALRSGTSPIR